MQSVEISDNVIVVHLHQSKPRLYSHILRDSVLGCDAVLICRKYPIFRKKALTPSSGSKSNPCKQKSGRACTGLRDVTFQIDTAVITSDAKLIIWFTLYSISTWQNLKLRFQHILKCHKRVFVTFGAREVVYKFCWTREKETCLFFLQDLRFSWR
jgi:hypothetical protein